MSEPDATPERDEAVAEVLERLRAGVRQRQAELACLDEQAGGLPAPLAALRRDAVLEEPTFRIEGAGPLRAFLERALYVLFTRRQHRVLLRQQNRFNRDVELAMGELHARQEALGRELRAVADRIGQLQGDTGHRAAAGDSTASGATAPPAVRGSGRV